MKIKKVTLLNIKQNLKDYSLKKLKSLANVLIDSLCDIKKEKYFLKVSLDDFENKKIALTFKSLSWKKSLV